MKTQQQTDEKSFNAPGALKTEATFLVDNSEKNPLSILSQSPTNTVSVQAETHISILKRLLKHTTPIAINNLISAAAGFGNALVITRIGADTIAANAYIGIVKNLFLLPTSTVFHSLQPILSRKFTENKPEEFASIFRSSIFLVVPVSVITIVVLLPIGSLLKALGQNPHLSDLTGEYFTYYVGSLPATLITQNLVEVFISTNNQMLLIPTSILRTALELGLSFAFVYGFKMGMNGWGLATLLHPWVSLVFISVGLKLMNRFDIFALFKPALNGHGWQEKMCRTLREQSDILRIGIPVGGQVFFELIAPFINALMIGKQSEIALVAYNIAGQWTRWVISIQASVSTSAAVLVASFMASDKLLALKKIKSVSLGVGLGISSVAVVICSAFYKPLTLVLLHQDSDYEAILSFSRVIFPLGSISTLGFGLKYIASGIARGHEKTKVPMMLDFIGSIAIGLTLATLFTYVFALGPSSIAVADLIGIIFSSLATTIYSYRLNQGHSDYSVLEDNSSIDITYADNVSEKQKERTDNNFAGTRYSSVSQDKPTLPLVSEVRTDDQTENQISLLKPS